MPPASYNIVYLPLADADLANIISYVAVELDSPRTATQLLEKIKSAVEQLRVFPYAHAIYPTHVDTCGFEIRSLIAGPYVILYYVMGDTVTIARIIHGKRDIQRILREA